MKKENKKQLVIEPEMVFEMKNNYSDESPDDPTTSLATTTFTHLLTMGGHKEQNGH